MEHISGHLHREQDKPHPSTSTVALDINKSGPWILLATILGSSLVFIDSSVVNVALPRIQIDLNTTFFSVQWW